MVPAAVVLLCEEELLNVVVVALVVLMVFSLSSDTGAVTGCGTNNCQHNIEQQIVDCWSYPSISFA